MSEVRVLDRDEEEKLLQAVAPGHENDWTQSNWKERRNLVSVLLMLDAGLRVGELVQLTYRDCYFATKPVCVLTVRAEVAKRKEQRDVPLSDRTTNALERFCPGHILLPDWPMTQKMISRTLQGAALTTRGIEKMIKNAGQAALGFTVHPHMLRHTFATKLMRITDIRTVQKLLGHKHVSSTQIYTHPNSEDLRTAIHKMNKGGACTREEPGGK